jgi:hypothetical protein
LLFRQCSVTRANSTAIAASLSVGFHCLSLHVSSYMAIFKCVGFFVYLRILLRCFFTWSNTACFPSVFWSCAVFLHFFFCRFLAYAFVRLLFIVYYYYCSLCIASIRCTFLPKVAAHCDESCTHARCCREATARRLGWEEMFSISNYRSASRAGLSAAPDIAPSIGSEGGPRHHTRASVACALPWPRSVT